MPGRFAGAEEADAACDECAGGEPYDPREPSELRDAETQILARSEGLTRLAADGDSANLTSRLREIQDLVDGRNARVRLGQ